MITQQLLNISCVETIVTSNSGECNVEVVKSVIKTIGKFKLNEHYE